MLLRGLKTVELRRYPAPAAFLGRPMLLLATADGGSEEGVATLPDELSPGDPAATTVREKERACFAVVGMTKWGLMRCTLYSQNASPRSPHK